MGTVTNQMQLHGLPQDIYLQNSLCNPEDGKTEKSCSYGRTFSFLRRGLEKFFDAIALVAESVFFTLKVICAEPNGFSCVIRKLDEHVLALIEKAKGSAGEFKKLKAVIRSTLSCIDILQIAADIDYCLKAKFKKDSKFTVLGRLSMFAAHIGEAVLWFSHTGFISLNKVSASLGNIRVFSKTIHISLSCATARVLGVAYAFFAMDALNRLLQPGNVFQKTAAKLELASNASEVLLDIMLIAGVVNVVGLGIMAGICMSLGIGALVYKEKYKGVLLPK